MSEQKFKRPIRTPGVREDAYEALGSTSGAIANFGVTLITATATGLVYQLPTPARGRRKTVLIDYTGATGNLVIANKSTATLFNGSTANVIRVSSSEQHGFLTLVGVSTANWWAQWSVTPVLTVSTSTGASYNSGFSFAGSTVTS